MYFYFLSLLINRFYLFWCASVDARSKQLQQEVRSSSSIWLLRMHLLGFHRSSCKQRYYGWNILANVVDLRQTTVQPAICSALSGKSKASHFEEHQWCILSIETHSVVYEGCYNSVQEHIDVEVKNEMIK